MLAGLFDLWRDPERLVGDAMDIAEDGVVGDVGGMGIGGRQGRGRRENRCLTNDQMIGRVHLYPGIQTVWGRRVEV